MAKPVWTAERTGRALVKSLLPVRARARSCFRLPVMQRGSFLWMQSGRSKRGFPAWTRSYLAAASGSRRSCGFF